jgi:AraC-like DNA-binding protein
LFPIPRQDNTGRRAFKDKRKEGLGLKGLRRLINGELGFRNFTAFLNSYRLAEVRDVLADPDQREVPILTIALDAGFGSLGPFNRAFREAEAMTD